MDLERHANLHPNLHPDLHEGDNGAALPPQADD
jgi:hypothetical protein